MTKTIDMKDEYILQIAGTDLNYRSVVVADHTPTALQILKAGGFKDLDQKTVIQILPTGDMEERRPAENCDLASRKPNRFIIADADCLFRFILDDSHLVWPEDSISEEKLRVIGNVNDKADIFIRREDEVDEVLNKGGTLDLTALGTEVLYSKSSRWKLNVQGVKIESVDPEISVSDALRQAEFDPDQGWIIILKSASGKRQVDLDFIIDLREPGIEKLRLTPKEINNGEVIAENRRDFKLLPIDEKHLDEMGADWETIVDGARRWFVYHAYMLPGGYNVEQIDLAVEVPTNYPGGQLDMFFCYPALTLSAGNIIAQTQTIESIKGQSFQRWSRHRGHSSPWNPQKDNLITHLGLVEESLLREVG
ncbi:MAG: hypothetical protein COA68_17595 [Oceanobacter sp.]|nr:MAG: hypothetical protein COA68_17595 [Oceanobacter sp.]